MQITTVEDTEGFAALQVEWTRLLGSSPNRTVFLTWEWLFSWWMTYGAGLALRILVARDSDGRVMGIAPLYARRSRLGPVEVTVFRFLGSHSVGSQYLDFICAPDLEVPVVSGLLRHVLQSETPSVLHFYRLPEASATLQVFNSVAPALHVSPARRETSHQLALPRDWETYLALLSPNMRSKMRRASRSVSDGVMSLRLGRKAAQGFLRQVETLHQERMSAKGQVGSFASSRFRRFWEEVAPRCADAGTLRTLELSRGEVCLAALAGFSDGNAFLFYTKGFEPSYRGASLGLWILGHAIHAAIEEGLRTFDFLGPGEYKEHFRGREVGTLSFAASASPHLVTAVAIVARARGFLSRLARLMLPGSIHRRLRNLRQRVLLALGRPMR